MGLSPLYPLRFEPIFTTNLWGGRRLPAYLNRTVDHDDPIGEAWVLSDVDGSPSRVADGPLAGRTLRELMAADPARIVGAAKTPQGRFPLLLKFLDARQELSVQVHPNDEQAAKLGPGKFGKTEAWVVLDADPATSRLYAGFAEGVSAADFCTALAEKAAPKTLHAFTPKPGDCVFLEAGTVHAIGADLLLFEVQQTSDITYRLYDWDRVDAKTKQPRPLHIDEGLACADFQRGPCPPVGPAVAVGDGVRREGLVTCAYFALERFTAQVPFRVGAANRCRAVVCVKGSGELESRGARYAFRTGDVFLLPAEVGACIALPAEPVTLLECGLPE
ncbi:type I phosphomannose isomerase catalytic subunit [Frigoriglobus tundricola]|uniref:Phosphohexomutase n=1 Tax=Frigoriglobus tundricola TaxID=2774151 RepID=A0A6M5YPN2_9BACT|nr:type I phosphomannose isomerase catalytic subunit [Frigoriglobus tundricola]QJW95306.1 Mannose-6-phosphate isomerase [Frigoriglobus tundricola]